MLTDSPGDRALCPSPWSRGVWSKTWVLGWELGKGHSTLALQQSQTTSPLATDLFTLVHAVPQRISKAIQLCTHQPWLVSLGEGHFIHKNASLSFFKKKKNSCSTTVIYIQRKTNLVYTVQSPKNIRGTHTYTPPPNLIFFDFTLALC